jgi:hypothetical protein
MIIKVISTQHKGDYYIQDTKKEDFTRDEEIKHLQCLERNKKAKLLDYKILS